MCRFSDESMFVKEHFLSLSHLCPYRVIPHDLIIVIMLEGARKIIRPLV